MSAHLLSALSAHATLWTLAFVAVVIVAQRMFASPGGRGRGLRFFGALAVVHVVAVAVAASVDAVVVEAGVLGQLALAWIGVIGTAHLLFEVLLPRMRMQPNRIFEDLGVAVAIAVASALVLKRAGLDITSLVATSAVVTAVIGLSLQDTLGNTIGGLALQLDDSIHVGDWVKIGDINGRVAEIRWRFTAIETRNWETVYVPNSRLVKDAVIVVGKRQGEPQQWRRWVYFTVDFRHTPSDVTNTVLEALHSAPIDNVASTPKPNCVLMDLGESTAKYAVRYWLTDIAADDPTDGAVRTRIFFALKRKGIPLALPAHALFITEDNKKRRERKQAEEHARRLEALLRVEVFAPLSEQERDHVADGLVYAPFTKGEVITRQGAEAHWLYLVVKGVVSVRVRGDDGVEVEVAKMNDGEVFGEMSLLTGEPRTASVYALSDVECWRLDREIFREVLKERPDVATPIAALLADRKLSLTAVKENLDAEAHARRKREAERDLLQKMRSFFGLD